MSTRERERERGAAGDVGLSSFFLLLFLTLFAPLFLIIAPQPPRCGAFLCLVGTAVHAHECCPRGASQAASHSEVLQGARACVYKWKGKRREEQRAKKEGKEEKIGAMNTKEETKWEEVCTENKVREEEYIRCKKEEGRGKRGVALFS